MQNAIDRAKSIPCAAQQEQEKAQRLSTPIGFGYDIIIDADSAGCITVFNAAVQKITGRSPSPTAFRFRPLEDTDPARLDPERRAPGKVESGSAFAGELARNYNRDHELPKPVCLWAE